jgi:predicted HAD superfamily phosphohydrolase YqeG
MAARREGVDRIRDRPGLDALDVGGIDNTTVILDIDGTITGDGQVFFSDSVLAKIRELASSNIVYVFSNHRNNTRNRIVASRVGCALIETPHRKPSPNVLRGLPPDHRVQPLLVIGDKIIVDGLFAWRIGARFIRVGRVRSNADRRLVRATYLLDDLVAAIVAIGRKPETARSEADRYTRRDR